MDSKNNRKRAQAGAEMLILVGFALVFIIPLALLLLSLSGTELGKTAVSQAKISARSIANEAGEVYLQGPGARKSIVVNYPEGIRDAKLEGGLVVLSMESDGRLQDIVSATFANISGNLSGKRASGLQRISMEYVYPGDYVNVTYG
ncbi:MAG: hypothetical protein WC588_00465 [Candidatus Micrarchaeia archaeon]